MTLTVVTKLWNLAEAAKTHAQADLRALEPRLREAASKVADAAEHFDAAVNEWIETHFKPELEAAKDIARKAYDQAAREAHDLYAEVKERF